MDILSLNKILRGEILESLQGSETVLVKTVMDLTSQAEEGSDSVTIPNVTGLALKDIVAGTEATAGGMSTKGDVLALDQVKQVPEYISYKETKDSAIKLKDAFLSVAPGVYAQGVEVIIANYLKTPSANDFDSASSTAGAFAIDDISKAKKLLDKARVPKKDRFMGVNAEGMETLAKMPEFQEGQKSLSPEALRDGVVSQVKGFKVVQSEDIEGTGATLLVHFYHRSAVAFALHAEAEYVEEEQKSKGRTFIALRGKYGAKDCENVAGAGKRKITMRCTTATE